MKPMETNTSQTKQDNPQNRYLKMSLLPNDLAFCMFSLSDRFLDRLEELRVAQDIHIYSFSHTEGFKATEEFLDLA